MRYHKRNLLISIFIAALFCFNQSKALATDNITITVEIVGFKKSAMTWHGEESYGIYDASFTKILSPTILEGVELKVYHHVSPNPGGRKNVDSVWRTNGEHITFTIQNSIFETIFNDDLKHKSGQLYYNQISVSKD